MDWSNPDTYSNTNPDTYSNTNPDTLMVSTLISEKFVRTVTSSDSFFTAFPEFNSLRAELEASKAPKRTGGCSRCGKGRRPGDRVLSGFLIILRSLSADRVAALKRRVNAQQLQFTGQNKITGAYEVMIL